MPYDAVTKSRSPLTRGVAALTDAFIRERHLWEKRTAPVAGSTDSTPSRVKKTACGTPPKPAATGEA